MSLATLGSLLLILESSAKASFIWLWAPQRTDGTRGRVDAIGDVAAIKAQAVVNDTVVVWRVIDADAAA